MGEVAENMLDGTLCCECGVFLGIDAGYPVKCNSCKPKKAKKKKPYKKHNNRIQNEKRY